MLAGSALVRGLTALPAGAALAARFGMVADRSLLGYDRLRLVLRWWLSLCSATYCTHQRARPDAGR